jgi:hypothetical protein
MTTTTKEEEIDLTDITRNNSQPTLISITKARREISRQLQTRVCADPHTHDHGHSYLVWSNSDWLKKQQVTSPINPPLDHFETNAKWVNFCSSSLPVNVGVVVHVLDRCMFESHATTMEHKYILMVI